MAVICPDQYATLIRYTNNGASNNPELKLQRCVLSSPVYSNVLAVELKLQLS